MLFWAALPPIMGIMGILARFARFFNTEFWEYTECVGVLAQYSNCMLFWVGFAPIMGIMGISGIFLFRPCLLGPAF